MKENSPLTVTEAKYTRLNAYRTPLTAMASNITPLPENDPCDHPASGDTKKIIKPVSQP